MREIVGLLLIIPWGLHELTLNAVFAVGASPSWPMCEYDDSVVSFLSRFFSMLHIKLSRAIKSVLASGKPFRPSMVWITVECK